MPDDTTVTETSTATTTAPETAAAPTTEVVTAEAGEGETSLMGGAGVEKPAEGEAAAAGETKEGESEKKVEAVIPEAYELAMPEGFAVDAALLEEATPVFKEIGLTNEQANKLVPMAAKLSENLAKQQNDTFQAMASDWARESKAAPDIGGTKWAETENNIARAFDTAANSLPAIPVIKDGKPVVENGKPVMMSGKEQVQSFRDLLGNSKLGNHPTMIRMFNFFGQHVGEDPSFVRSDAGAHIKPSREDILYGASETK